jgi:TRAP-type C4-dicarboxylate transport system substrate-binding protein
MSRILVRWVLAHEPIEIFIRAAEKFKEIVEEKAPGKFDIEILMLSEYSKKYLNGKKITKHNLLDLMAENQIEMSQMYTYVLSKFNKDLNVLDMPFLFRDHDHAARIFEGEIGEELLSGYSKTNSKIHGLAFTYSGGYKNLPFNKKVTCLDDLQGAKVRVSNSPVCYDTFKALGAEPIVMDVEEITPAIKDGRIDAGESSWPRIYGCEQNTVAKSIFNTGHSLLLTNIIANTDFLSNLDNDMQEVFKEAAIEAGRFERQISVDDVEPTKEKARKDGIDVIDLSPNDQEKFKEITNSLYESYKSYFSDGLITKIKTS